MLKEETKLILGFPKEIKIQTLKDALEQDELGIFFGLSQILLEAPISEGGLETEVIEQIHQEHLNKGLLNSYIEAGIDPEYRCFFNLDKDLSSHELNNNICQEPWHNLNNPLRDKQPLNSIVMIEHLYPDGNPYLKTNVLPKYNCSNCKHFITDKKEIFETKAIGFYAVECNNITHPLADCILRGFEAHSDQPGFTQTLNK